MAMNYAWQERKKFAVPVAVGAAVLVIWYFFILSGINRAIDIDIAKRKSAEMLLRSRMVAGVPTDEVVGRSDRDRATFQNDLKAIRDKLEFRVEESFKVKEGQSTAAKFGRERTAVHGKIETRANSIGFPKIDSRLGFPATFSDLSEPVLAEWLLRLAIVQRVCMLSMDSSVTELKLVEVVPGEHQEDPTIGADHFLGVLTVKFSVKGPAESVLKLCHGLQQEGPAYLALEAAEVTYSDPTRNLLGAVLTVGALVVRPEGVLITEARP